MPECGEDVGTPGFICNGPPGHKGPHAWKGMGWDDFNVYRLFCQEVEGFTIKADESAVSVVERLTRACARAQMVHDGTLPVLAERTNRDGY